MNRLTPLVALLALSATLAVGCGSSSAPTKLNATITVENGKPEGGVQSLKVKKGGTVHLVVNSDTADEVHIHRGGRDQRPEVGSRSCATAGCTRSARL